MSIVRPRIWTQQPQIPVGIDPPLSQGHIFNPATGLMSNRGVSVGLSNTIVSTGSAGVVWKTDGINVNSINLSNVPEIPRPWTYIIHLSRRAEQDDARLHTPTSGTLATVISLSVAGSGSLDILDSGVAWRPIGNLATHLPVGKFRTIVITMSAAKDVFAYINGVMTGSTAISANTYLGLGGSNVFVGGNYATFGAAVQFDVAAIACIPFDLPQAHALAVSANPWQIFAPRVT